MLVNSLVIDMNAMMNHKTKDIAKIKGKAKNFIRSELIFHRCAIDLRKLYAELMIVLNDAIKIINYISHNLVKEEFSN